MKLLLIPLIAILISSCKKDDGFNFHIKGIITEMVTGKPIQNQMVETFYPASNDAFGFHPEKICYTGITDDSGYFDIHVEGNDPIGTSLRVTRGCGEDFPILPFGSPPDVNKYFTDTIFHFQIHAVSTIEVALADTGLVTTVDSILIFKVCDLSFVPILPSSEASIIIYDATAGLPMFQDYGGTQNFDVEIYTPTVQIGKIETVDVPDDGVFSLEINY